MSMTTDRGLSALLRGVEKTLNYTDRPDLVVATEPA
jgi:hypothetical protein